MEESSSPGDNERRPRPAAPDRELLLDVIALNPILDAVAACAAEIEADVSYPIDTPTQIRSVHDARLDNTGHMTAAACSISCHQVDRYFPDGRFPISTRSELLSQLTHAIQAEQVKELGTSGRTT